jgi:FKBP-type peptidyl-prolyl cis-trans isomerase
MTQTVKGNNTEPSKQGQGTPQKQRRPGQRQQQRILRQQRRRRRQLIWTSVIVAVVVIGVASLSFWQFQRIQTEQANAKATATAQAKAHATATAQAQASATALAESPATPPPVTGTTVTLKDGLKYIDIKVGSGTAAKSGSTVSVQYTGWLASNGNKFDSSYSHGGQPFQFQLGQGKVIPGWDEGLVGMKPGGERRLIIPASLGYGASGSPPTIPGNATLIFDVTMVSVQ